MSLTGHIENGVVVFDGPVSLPEGTSVEISVCAPPQAPNATTHFERFKDIIGAAAGLPENFAENHDPARVTEPDSRPSLWDRLKPVAGKADGLPADTSTRVDHYLTHGLAEERLQLLRSAATDCGVSLSNEAVSSEGLYD